MTENEAERHSRPKKLRGAQVIPSLESVHDQDDPVVSREGGKLPLASPSPDF